MKLSRALLREWVNESKFLSLTMTYKDAVADGDASEGEFLAVLNMVLKEEAGWRRQQAAWATFIKETLPRVKDDLLSMQGQDERIRRDMAAEQRKLNATTALKRGASARGKRPKNPTPRKKK